MDSQRVYIGVVDFRGQWGGIHLPVGIAWSVLLVMEYKWYPISVDDDG